MGASVLECAGATNFSSDHHECVDASVPDGAVAQAVAETPEYQAADNVDVDDTAVWESHDPGSSLVLGTLKLGGLDLYNLQGELLDHLDAPTSGDGHNRLNNVGVLDGNGVVVVTDRGRDQLRFYRVRRDGDDASLEDITADDVPRIFPGSELSHSWNAYGLTVATLSDGHGYAFVTRHWQPDVAKVRVRTAADGKMTYEVVQSLRLPQSFNNSFTGWQPWDACSPCNDTAMGAEGMVVDTSSGRLFIAQEWLGLYVADAEDFRAESLRLLDVSDVFGRPYDRVLKEDWGLYECQFQGRNREANIRKDAEGLGLYARGHHSQGYLVLSSQGSDRYELYARQEPFGHLGSFRIELNHTRTHHTDGVEVSSSPLGAGFRRGIVIVQDQASHSSTNFKFLSWAALEDAIAEAGL